MDVGNHIILQLAVALLKLVSKTLLSGGLHGVNAP
jgi:hypothetical protein